MQLVIASGLSHTNAQSWVATMKELVAGGGAATLAQLVDFAKPGGGIGTLLRLLKHFDITLLPTGLNLAKAMLEDPDPDSIEQWPALIAGVREQGGTAAFGTIVSRCSEVGGAPVLLKAIDG